MTKVLITGGTGVLGRALLARPAAARHDVRVSSRRAPAGLAAGVEWARMDLATGDGLEAALEGVDTIIHAASGTRGANTRQVDVEGTRALLARAGAAGVKHVVYVSIVGVDRVPFPYYRHKLAAEVVVRAGAVPWTILRIVQFHDFIDIILRAATRLPVGLLPKDWKSQPIDVGEAAEALWACVDAGPTRRVDDLAGPEVLTFGEMARRWKAARGIRKPILHLPIPGAVSAGFRRGLHTAPHLARGGTTWDEWLEKTYGAARAAGAEPKSAYAL